MRPVIRSLRALALLSCVIISSGSAQADGYDYFAANRILIRNGVQAVLMCNGLFTSHRTLEQVFAQELRYLKDPVGTADGGEYVVDSSRKAVAIGGADYGPVIRAAFREGIGCVVMAPDQTFDDIEKLPSLDLPAVPGDASTIPWPNGDRLEQSPLPDSVNAQALQAASDWAFDRDSPEQDTLSLIVLHKGEIIHERYADGVDMHTRTRTWSTAKSIAATLFGMLVDDGRLDLDAPLGLEWLPSLPSPGSDPRNAISLRHLLNMSSGLEPVDSFRMEYATGSGLAYWAGLSSTEGALNRGLVRTPGTVWEYENYDTLLAVLAMKIALGNEQTYREFPRRALFDRIGMRNTLASTDRFHDFIFSSQVYTNARDLARFGQLYLQGGVWDGERIISGEWIKFVTTPAPSTASIGNFYGAQWWLVPDERSDVPKDAYRTSGNRGQYVVVVPSHDVVIVRRGLDYGKQGFDSWDLTREVLKAFDSNVIAPGASLRKLAGDYIFTEGPAADAAGNVYFTDQPNDRIVKWNAADGAVEDWLKPSGRANGLFFDPAGNLLAAADEKNQLWSIAADKTVTVLISNFDDKPLNGPNDVWTNASGHIYFTDPLYARPYWERDSAMQQSGQHVYMIPAGGTKAEVIITDYEQPNGIIGSLDGKILYVSDIGGKRTYAYDIAEDGTLQNKRLFCELGSDGMTVDNEGNVYLTGKGVTVFNRHGEQIEHIDVPRDWTANVTFGGTDRDLLFITASTAIYGIKMRVKGVLN